MRATADMKQPNTIPLTGYVDLLALNTACPQRYPFLLESVSYHAAHGRFDILFVSLSEQLSLSRQGKLDSNAINIENDRFLAHLDRWWSRERRCRSAAEDLPFSGGWFLYLGYELAGQLEPTVAFQQDGQSCLPMAMAVRCPAAIIKDRRERTSWLVCEAGYDKLMEQVLADIDTAGRLESGHSVDVLSGLVEEDPAVYLDGVNRIKHYIREGDVFQVNLSRAWRGSLTDEASYEQIYRQLRQHNPAPFAGICRFDGGAILSSSPERLVRVDHRQRIETRPIAGTRPRGMTARHDRALSQRLLAHPKEKAEHVMLIDLERNDLGRICRPGTIRVSELLSLESYAHVHHIVSSVTGTLSPGVTPGQVIRAVFPGGTITGCPKIRCMEIIHELEHVARGPYTGSAGYLNHDGSMDLNILIRTIVAEGRKITFRAGAGIVADSVAEKELDETRAKARGMTRAVCRQRERVSC